MTDPELDRILNFAKTIPENRRAEFLEILARTLSTSSDFGEGVVERALITAQRALGPQLGVTILLR